MPKTRIVIYRLHRLAEINVELFNMKQDLVLHKTDNRKDLEILRSDLKVDTKEILRKIDEIQIYLRDNPKH